jgi:hypothetical protein
MHKLLLGVKAAWRHIGWPFALIVLLVLATAVWAAIKAIFGMIVVCGLVLVLLLRMAYDTHDMPMGSEVEAAYDALPMEAHAARDAQAYFLRQRNNVLGMHDGADL